MNTRYSDSLINDPILRITISLTKILILNETNDTPWANTSFNAPNISFNKDKSTLQCYSSVAQFALSMSTMSTSMSNLNLTFDHAVAIVKYIFSKLF